jgi:hypothetical protein
MPLELALLQFFLPGLSSSWVGDMHAGRHRAWLVVDDDDDLLPVCN